MGKTNRLIKEGLCDRSNAPSVSAISRLMKGKDDADAVKTEKGQSHKYSTVFFHYFLSLSLSLSLVVVLYDLHLTSFS